MPSPKRDDRPPYLDFGLELERARRKAGLTTTLLASRVAFDPRTVRRYLKGERLPDLETTRAWERACDLEPGQLTRHHPEAKEADQPSEARESEPSRNRRRRSAVIGAGVAVLALAAVLAFILVRGPGDVEQTVERAKRLRTTYPQVTGGPARTWSDFTIAGGDAGRSLDGKQRIQVACRVRGFQVESGNDWWYLVASPPWRNEYFATADAFFNEDRIEGLDFRKTRFVDPRVPECP